MILLHPRPDAHRPSSEPRRRALTGFALLDVLTAAILLAAAALAAAAPLTQALAALEDAARAVTRTDLLVAAASEAATSARRGDCSTGTVAIGAVQVRRRAAPPGVAVTLLVRDSTGPLRRRRADSLQLWLPCTPAVP